MRCPSYGDLNIPLIYLLGAAAAPAAGSYYTIKYYSIVSIVYCNILYYTAAIIYYTCITNITQAAPTAGSQRGRDDAGGHGAACGGWHTK